jgi:hypothetical protein
MDSGSPPFDSRNPPQGPPIYVDPVRSGARTSGKAIASLVLGCASFFFWILTSIPGIILGILALRDIKRSQGMVTGEGLAIGGIVTGGIGSFMGIGCAGIMIALLLPAVQAAREAARNAQSMNNLRQISMGLAAYESAKARYPVVGTSARGEGANLSWRVHILPYLGEDALYSEFHLDEPWDSPHNIQLLPRMPLVYQSTGHETMDGTTMYQAVTGPGTAFQGPPGATVRSIRDGASNTIMLVEVDSDRAVEWTKPDDWVLDPSDPFDGLGNLRQRGALAVFFDTHVETIPNYIPPEELKAMMTASGSEPTMRSF